MKTFWHLPWLLCSSLASILIIILWNPFARMGTGMLVATLLAAIAASHLLSGIVGFLLQDRNWRRLVIVLSIAMLPTFLFSLSQVHRAWYLRYRAVYDRFRDNLASPIPSSVASLDFIPLAEKHEAHLMFRFTISPQDLDGILKSKGFVEISTGGFRRPDDLFTHPNYLPLAEPVAFFTLNNMAAGYPDKGIGEGYTLKVSVDRRHVIFRRESAPYYLYKYWESDMERSREEEFLLSLSKNSTNTNAK